MTPASLTNKNKRITKQPRQQLCILFVTHLPPEFCCRTHCSFEAYSRPFGGYISETFANDERQSALSTCPHGAPICKQGNTSFRYAKFQLCRAKPRWRANQTRFNATWLVSSPIYTKFVRVPQRTHARAARKLARLGRQEFGTRRRAAKFRRSKERRRALAPTMASSATHPRPRRAVLLTILAFAGADSILNAAVSFAGASNTDSSATPNGVRRPAERSRKPGQSEGKRKKRLGTGTGDWIEMHRLSRLQRVRRVPRAAAEPVAETCRDDAARSSSNEHNVWGVPRLQQKRLYDTAVAVARRPPFPKGPWGGQ